MVQFGLGYLQTLGRLLSLRNSVRAADYDHRAFDSWIPLQRSWQRRRFEVVHSFMGPQASRSTLDIGCGSSRIVQTLPGVIGMDLGMHKLRWLRAPARRRQAAAGTAACHTRPYSVTWWSKRSSGHQ